MLERAIEELSGGPHMRRLSPALAFALTIVVASWLSGCGFVASERGSFDRDLTVTGSVRLDLASGSGAVRISPGPADKVHIHGEVRASGYSNDDARRRLDEIIGHPPVDQSGNTIRVGKERWHLRNVSIEYTIDVPPDTEVESALGSGAQSIEGVRGPVRASSGSGSVHVAQIREETQINAASGSVEASDIRGEFRCNAASGSIMVSRTQGDVRATAASGSIHITSPGGRVTAQTASGGVDIDGATSDVSARSASGSVHVRGNPAANSLWELHSVSGGVEVTVPLSAAFQFSGSAVSGGVHTDMPIVVEEQGGHSLRGRVGNGGARIEASTVSGSIHLKSAN